MISKKCDLNHNLFYRKNGAVCLKNPLPNTGITKIQNIHFFTLHFSSPSSEHAINQHPRLYHDA